MEKTERTWLCVACLVTFAFGALAGASCGNGGCETPDGYETVACRLVEVRGDTVVTINKMVKAGEE